MLDHEAELDRHRHRHQRRAEHRGTTRSERDEGDSSPHEERGDDPRCDGLARGEVEGPHANDHGDDQQHGSGRGEREPVDLPTRDCRRPPRREHRQHDRHGDQPSSRDACLVEERNDVGRGAIEG